MSHPYKDQASKSHKSKTQSMGKVNNLDIPIMRAVGENKSGGVHESSATMQHKDQAANNGMKRGGRMAYPLHGAGSQSGEGRLQKNHKGKPPFTPILRGD